MRNLKIFSSVIGWSPRKKLDSMSIGWIGFSNICKTDLPSWSLRLFLHTSRLWKRIPALPTGKSNRRRTRFFYIPINISSRNLLSFRQMAPLNQSPWDRTLAKGYGITTLPDALAKKYTNANKEWAWQWVFPSKSLVVHSVSGMVLRHHVQPSTL